MAAAGVPGLLAATALAGLVGVSRKWLCCGLLLACSITTALCAADPGPEFVTALTMATYAFAVGAWATLNVLTRESYPLKVRSAACGVARMWACFGGMVAGPAGATILHKLHTLMVMYAAAFACAMLAVALVLPASAGRTVVD